MPEVSAAFWTRRMVHVWTVLRGVTTIWSPTTSILKPSNPVNARSAACRAKSSCTVMSKTSPVGHRMLAS
ncbi:hypothetical protein AC230_23820 [Streptomyces caatingaensis]|uniref:Uncharacterized protein n=1 Tax=Streptomyces caatingaensis TaxID=1678637 RepID=A0A0K9X8P4_9ACTN|nr:hypothetical protein AC230_23820 [Streptomyces caatingaensis]